MVTETKEPTRVTPNDELREHLKALFDTLDMISVLPCLHKVFPENLERWQNEKPCRSEIIAVHRLHNAIRDLSLYLGNKDTPPETDEVRKLSYTFSMLAGAVYEYCERHPLQKIQRK